MKNQVIKLFVLFLSLFLVGCNALRIHEGVQQVSCQNQVIEVCDADKTNCHESKIRQCTEKTTKREGIPFYIKVGKIKQTTKYSRSWIVMTLEYSELDEKGAATKKQSAKFLASPKDFTVASAYDALLKAQQKVSSLEKGDVGGFPAARQAFADSIKSNCDCNLSLFKVQEDLVIKPGEPVHLLEVKIGNQTEIVQMVDYSKKYYFNSRIPPFGTANASIELAADGTLTKAESSVDASKLADLIPLKEFLIDKLSLGATAVVSSGSAAPVNDIPGISKVNEDEVTVLLTLTINTDGFYYVFTKHFDLNTVVNLNKEHIIFGDPEASFVRTAFGSSGAKKEDSNAIEFSGKVKMPKKSD